MERVSAAGLGVRTAEDITEGCGIRRFWQRYLACLVVLALLISGCTRRGEVRPEKEGPGRETLLADRAGMRLDYDEILKSKALTREDVAALLVEGVGDAGTLRMRPRFYDPDKGVTDIQSSRRRVHIERAVELGLMDVFPDGTFQPKDVVQRAHFAIVIQNILKASRRAALARQETSPYGDVPTTHYAYNAILLAVQTGMLRPRSPGVFAPFDPIDGEEAVRAIDRLKVLLR